MGNYRGLMSLCAEDGFWIVGDHFAPKSYFFIMISDIQCRQKMIRREDKYSKTPIAMRTFLFDFFRMRNRKGGGEEYDWQRLRMACHSLCRSLQP